MRRRMLLAGASAALLPRHSRAAGSIAIAPPTLRQVGGRALWQPVTNRNSTNGSQGTPGTSNPDTLSRVTKTVQATCTDLRTVLMGFQMNPYEQPLIGNNSGVTGAYSLIGVTVNSGGTGGYTIGDVLTMSKGTADFTAVVLIVTRLSAGVITEVEIADPGAYAAALADGAAPSTALKRGGGASAGAGATFNFVWREFAIAAQLGIEPAGLQTGTNAAAIIPAGIGLHYDGLSPNTTLLVPDAGYIVTDPVRLSAARGSTYAERIATIGAPPGTQRTTMGVDYFANAATARTGAFSGTLAAGTGSATMATITLGRPAAPTPWFCIVGDSIDYGIVGGNGTVTDTGDASQNSGWVERGLQLAGGFGLLSITRSGDALGSWYLTNNRRHMRLNMLAKLADTVNFASCVFVVGLCVNDITASTTAANIQAMMQWIAQDLLSLNPAGLFYSTCMPGAITSTDSFATVANQTAPASANDANRQTVNAWLRAGGGGLFAGSYGTTRTGIIDRAAVVEVSNGTAGVWKAGYTTDGTHPTQATHANILAPLIQAQFAGFALPG